MIQWLFPPCCPVCLQPVVPKGAYLHETCAKKLRPLQEPICKKCGKELQSEEEEYCAECVLHFREWDMGRSLFPYCGQIRRAVHCVKQDGTKEFVEFFARQAELLQTNYIRRIRPDCLVPVPLHPAKQRKRGFNQAELFAVELGKRLELPVHLLLRKVKNTREQKQLTREQRKGNVRDAFAADLSSVNRIPPRILLVDDIATTGSTLSACAATLKAAGAEQVFYITICAGDTAD